MKRLPDYKPRLRAEMKARAELSYDLGPADCIRLCLAAIKAQTGVDRSAEVPEYTTEAEAIALIESFGGMVEAVSHYLGPPVGRNLAKYGDIVMGPFAPGVCLGRLCAFQGQRGYIYRELAEYTACWPLERDDE